MSTEAMAWLREGVGSKLEVEGEYSLLELRFLRFVLNFGVSFDLLRVIYGVV